MTQEEDSPLQALIAKYRYHMDFAELDLSDINRQCCPEDDALIHLVARVGTLEEMRLLVTSGARVNSIGDIGYTPLHYAAMRGRLDMIDTLLTLGSERTTRNEFGETPADVARYAGHAGIAQVLKSRK